MNAVTRFRSFSAKTGCLASDIVILQPYADNIGTCYDFINGCLWSVDAEKKVINKFAASTTVPLWTLSFARKGQSYSAEAGSHFFLGQIETDLMKKLEAPLPEVAQFLLTETARIALSTSPIDPHVKNVDSVTLNTTKSSYGEKIYEGQFDVELAKVNHLHPGMSVSARYGPGWFSGEISRINEDGTCVVLYADGDIRTAVPA